MWAMKCCNCNEEIPDFYRFCTVCGADAGCPNVRAALRSDEVDALKLRVKEAEEYVTARGCKDILDQFCNSIAQSSVVIGSSLGRINALLSSDNELFVTFYKAVGSEARIPEDNAWDKIRQSVDSLLFPYYYEDIHFGSLSLDLTGISIFGSCFMVLKDLAIKDRATVFEENSIIFIRNHGIVAGDPFPLGYRATWTNRSLLVAAKLGKRLTPTTTEAEFPKLLADSDTKDFVEVHIYGPIHRRAIKHLSVSEPLQKPDKVILKSVIKKCKEIGASMEISR
jgi:hypothetical protein